MTARHSDVKRCRVVSSPFPVLRDLFESVSALRAGMKDGKVRRCEKTKNAQVSC